MKNSSSLLLSVVLMALPCAEALAGNVYKWVDDQGVVHYTDQKPGEREAERLDVRTGQSATSVSASASDLNAAVENLERQREIQDLGKRQAAEAEQEKQHKKELCESARKNLEVIQNNARIRIDDNGSQRYLTPEEILQKRDSFDKIVKEHC